MSGLGEVVLARRWMVVAMALLMVMTVLIDSAYAGGSGDGDKQPGVDCNEHQERCRPRCDDTQHGDCKRPPDCDKNPTHPKCDDECDPNGEKCDPPPPPPPENNPPSIEGCEAIDAFDLSLLPSITAVGSEVGVVLATDPDGDTLSFSGADEDGLFGVSVTGTISVAAALPAPSSVDYTVQVDVTVSDGELSTTGICNVTVDPSEVMGVEATSIYASSPVGTQVDVAILGDDAWVPTVTSEFFAFDSATNVISVAAPFPRPSIGSTGDARSVNHELEFDGGTFSELSTAFVTVNVVDFFDDDNPDVYADASAYEDAINWLADPAVQGRISPVTSGCAALAYCPDEATSRGHFAVFVTRIWELVDESVDPAAEPNPFADVDGHRFQLWIEALLNAGITSGCGLDANGDLIYCPEESVEWGEFAIMVNRAVRTANPGETAAGTQTEALEWLASSGFNAGVLAADVCETGSCQNVPIKRGPTALVLRNIWDLMGLGG